MRDVPLSTCEKDFILKNIAQHRRLDNRKTYDYRNVRISFGVTFGCCHVQLGKTRVLAQVSCEVGQPKATRGNEGVLYVNVELSSMASPAFEAGRQTDESVELSRLMERCLKESRCLDLESLCIVSGEKVWHLRTDIHVLNHEGNILDCASIAAIAALAHFRRPDVTVKGEEIIIHSMEDRNPVPLSIHHMPLLVSFAFFCHGQYMLIDPSEKEEKVTEGKMVIGMNKHREICTLQVTGEMLMMKEQVLRCSNIAVMKVTRMTELIHEALQNDKEARKRGEKHGFAELVSKDKLSANCKPKTDINVSSDEEASTSMEDQSEEEEDDDGQDVDMDEKPNVEILAKGVGMIGEGGTSHWLDLSKKAEEMKVEKQEKQADGQKASKRRLPKSDDHIIPPRSVVASSMSSIADTELENFGSGRKGEDSEEEEKVVVQNIS